MYPFVGGDRAGGYGGGTETKGRYMLTVIKFNVLARLSRFQVFSEFIICIFKHEVFGLAKIGETQQVWLTLA